MPLHPRLPVVPWPLMDWYTTATYAPPEPLPSLPTALPAAYLMRLRTGLGLVVVCSALSMLTVMVILVMTTRHPEAIAQHNYAGGVMGLGAVVGWWVFATPAPAPAPSGIAWGVRIALIVLLCSMVNTILTAPADPAAPPSFSLATAAWGVLSAAASITQFYGTLILIRRVGAAMGDAWVQRHAVVCMIALPALFLLAITGMAIFVAITMTGVAQSTLGSNQTAPLPDLPIGPVMVIVLGLMGAVGVWYLGFWARVWLKLMRYGEHQQKLAPAM